MKRRIGVLALQGDFAKHKTALQKCGVDVLEIRMPKQLKNCDGLVIPGGESTTLTKLMNLYGFYKPIQEFSEKYPIMGTCAGMIMLSDKVNDDRVEPLKLINIETSRNVYGRQIDSFIASVEFQNEKFLSYFIRAPKIIGIGEGVETIAEYKAKPIAVRQNNVLLENNKRIYNILYFYPSLLRKQS